MNRLTVRGTGEARSDVTIIEILNKLRYYEDLEEDGRLKILPCKEEDWVYCLRESWDGWHIDKKHFKSKMIDKVGKTVFLTYEEADVVVKEKEKEYQKGH